MFISRNLAVKGEFKCRRNPLKDLILVLNKAKIEAKSKIVLQKNYIIVGQILVGLFPILTVRSLLRMPQRSSRI